MKKALGLRAQGLGELYEEEYQAAAGGAAEDKEEPLRTEACALLKALFLKLDALSHFSFAPKPVVEDMAVRADVPALAMEEVAPQVTVKTGPSHRVTQANGGPGENAPRLLPAHLSRATCVCVCGTCGPPPLSLPLGALYTRDAAWWLQARAPNGSWVGVWVWAALIGGQRGGSAVAWGGVPASRRSALNCGWGS